MPCIGGAAASSAPAGGAKPEEKKEAKKEEEQADVDMGGLFGDDYWAYNGCSIAYFPNFN